MLKVAMVIVPSAGGFHAAAGPTAWSIGSGNVASSGRMVICSGPVTLRLGAFLKL